MVKFKDFSRPLSVFKYFSRQILFSRTFQDALVYSSTFQACANPALDLINYAHVFGQHLITAPSTPRLNVGGTAAGLPLNTVNLEIFAGILFHQIALKRHICDVKKLRTEHDLPMSVNNRMISPICEGLIFTKLRIFREN